MAVSQLLDIPLPGMHESDTVGARIRHYRKQRGMSQVDLTKKARVPNGYIADLERGAILTPRDPDNLRKIAVVLGVPLRVLAGPTGWYEEEQDDNWRSLLLSDPRLNDSAKQTLVRIIELLLAEEHRSEERRSEPKKRAG